MAEPAAGENKRKVRAARGEDERAAKKSKSALQRPGVRAAQQFRVCERGTRACFVQE